MGPWAQPKATRGEGGRRAERPAGSYATPDTPCSRTAPEGSLPTERGQTVPALRPELDDPNLFGSSNRSATAGRSPRTREAEGRLAPEMAESHEARSQAQAQRRAWSQCIATWAASGVAVPRAFFGTFFRAERKYYPLRGGSPTSRAGVGASISPEGYAPKGLSARLLETFGHQIWPEANENCISCALGKMAAHRHRLGGPSEKTIVSSRPVVRSTCWGAITGGKIDP